MAEVVSSLEDHLGQKGGKSQWITGEPNLMAGHPGAGPPGGGGGGGMPPWKGVSLR